MSAVFAIGNVTMATYCCFVDFAMRKLHFMFFSLLYTSVLNSGVLLYLLLLLKMEFSNNEKVRMVEVYVLCNKNSVLTATKHEAR